MIADRRHTDAAPTCGERTTLIEDLADLANDVAKLIVLTILIPVLMFALAGAAEALKGVL